MSLESKQFSFIIKSNLQRKSKWGKILDENLKKIDRAKISSGCNKIPINLEKFSNYLGFKEIREIPLSKSSTLKGRIIKEKGNYILEISKNLEKYNKNFVIAHELAHMIIDAESLRRSIHRTKFSGLRTIIGFANFETLCDKCAEEILLPSKYLESQLNENNKSIDLVLQIAQDSKNSLQLVASKIVDIGEWNGWKCKFFWWKIISSMIQPFDSRPKLPQNELLFLRPKNVSKSIIYKCAAESKKQKGKEHLISYNGLEDIHNIECIKIAPNEIFSVSFR